MGATFDAMVVPEVVMNTVFGNSAPAFLARS